MVVGGYNNNLAFDLSSVEVIDLENPSSTCSPVHDYPKGASGMALAIIDGLVRSCGDSDDSILCYDFDPATNFWTPPSARMLFARYRPRGSIVNGVWLLSGDGNSLGDVGDVTEMWTGSEFELGPILPTKMFSHCQLTVNTTHVFFVDTYDTKNAFLLDVFEQKTTDLPQMTIDRSYPSCGMINNPENGLEAFIVEDGVSEVFNFNDLTWRIGPSLPSFNHAGYAQLTDTFVLVGGSNDAGETLTSIYQFDHINYEWIAKTQRLQIGRQLYPGVIAVPDDFVHCS